MSVMCIEEKKLIKFLMSYARIELKLNSQDFYLLKQKIDESFLSGKFANIF